MSEREPKSWASDLSWDSVAEQEHQELRGKVNPIDGTHSVDSKTSIDAATLPFYPDEVRLLRLNDSRWPAKLRIYYLEHGEQLYRLNGTSPPIHEVNAKLPIGLSESNALAYLRFFCFFVRGEEGPFLVFESLEQPEIPGISNAEERAKLEKNAYPARLCETASDGTFLVAGMIWYGSSVFAALFKILATGMVELSDDEPVLDDLETRVDAPLS